MQCRISIPAPAWQISTVQLGSLAQWQQWLLYVVTQDNLTLDQKLKTLKSAETERTHAAILI